MIKIITRIELVQEFEKDEDGNLVLKSSSSQLLDSRIIDAQRQTEVTAPLNNRFTFSDTCLHYGIITLGKKNAVSSHLTPKSEVRVEIDGIDEPIIMRTHSTTAGRLDGATSVFRRNYDLLLDKEYSCSYDPKEKTLVLSRVSGR